MQLRVVVVLLFVSWTITAVVGGNLYATWSSLYGTPLTMSYLDPQTAKQGKQILTVEGVVELFAITPGIDQANQRVFVPFITAGEQIEGEEGPSPFQSSLYTFDISNPNAVKILFKTPLPQAYVLGVLYDPVDDGAFVIAMNLNNDDEAAPDTNVYMGFVSAKDGSFRNVTVFPPTLVPFGGALGGTPVALDPKNRIIVMGTIANRKQDPLVTVYNINTKTFTTKPNPAFFIGAMSFNPLTGKFLCLLEPHNSAQGNLSYAILNPSTATYNIITTWSATSDLFFIIGSMSTLDAANNKLYSVIGNGEGPPVALVTINAVTGKRDNVVYFGANQPQSIFFL